MHVHETTCGLVEMLGFAVNVFRPALPRQLRYARLRRPSMGAVEARGTTATLGQLHRGAHAAVRAPYPVS